MNEEDLKPALFAGYDLNNKEICEFLIEPDTLNMYLKLKEDFLVGYEPQYRYIPITINAGHKPKPDYGEMASDYINKNK